MSIWWIKNNWQWINIPYFFIPMVWIKFSPGPTIPWRPLKACIYANFEAKNVPSHQLLELSMHYRGQGRHRICWRNLLLNLEISGLPTWFSLLWWRWSRRQSWSHRSWQLLTLKLELRDSQHTRNCNCCSFTFYFWLFACSSQTKFVVSQFACFWSDWESY